MSTPRNGRSPRRPVPIAALFLLAALAAGCSSGRSPEGPGEPMIHTDVSGRSVPNWLVLPTGGAHTRTATLDFIDSGLRSSCTECHGADLSGGISGKSCFANAAGCHHGPVPSWRTPVVHGAAAKQEPGSSGFRSCQICHGIQFSGGGSGIRCFGCHTVDAPHAQRPWRGSGVTHDDVDASNAPVCAQCHSAGSPLNPAGRPPVPAAEGSAPGCFNNTLCHGFYAQNRVSGGASER